MAKAARVWTCQRRVNKVKCGQVNPRRLQICTKCGKRRPATKQPSHMAILKTVTYEQCVERWGEHCGICGAPRPPSGRRLNRDHDHKTGELRGLLCTRCNRQLPDWVDADWLLLAHAYLVRPR
jgi:hypothetical protein